MGGTIFTYSTQFPEVVASIQLQALIPAHHLGAKVLYFGAASSAPADFLDRYRPDVLIFSKLFDETPLALATEAKKRGVRIIGYVADFHIEGSALRQRNERLSEFADVMVVGTETLARMMRKHWKRDVVVIEEPIRFPRQAVRFEPGPHLRILWQGSSDNFDTLHSGIAKLAMYADRPVFLMIVADRSPTQEELGLIQSNIKVNYLPWSPRIQVDMSAQCDMLFLPSLNNDRKAGKSHNRLVEAINAGRLAIAHPLPQYRGLADFCLCDADYAKSVRIAVAEPAAMRNRIARGQQYIDGRFAQEIVAEKWQQIIERR